MDLTQVLLDDHELRKEQVSHLKAQAKQFKETAERTKAETQAKRIKNCDGSSTQRLREWFRDIDMTVPYAPGKTVYITTLTSEGSLRREIEKALNSAQDRATVTWQELKDFLTRRFMSSHEAEKLRDDLVKIVRQPYETTAHYGRRFSEAAELAYPANRRNLDQQTVMLRLYMKGLGDEKIVLRLIQETNSADYLEAIEAVARFESDSYQVYRTLNGVAPPETRAEERMDISAIRGASNFYNEGACAAVNDGSVRPQGRAISGRQQLFAGGRTRLDDERWDHLERQVTGLSREFTKMMAMVTKQEGKGGRPSSPPRQRQAGRPQPNPRSRNAPGPRVNRQPKWTEDGRPICLNCERAGHFKRECPRNQRSSTQDFHGRHPRQGRY